MTRNRRKERACYVERRLTRPMSVLQAGIAAMLVDGESRAKRIAQALGRSPKCIEDETRLMRQRYGVETTVALALALYREAHA